MSERIELVVEIKGTIAVVKANGRTVARYQQRPGEPDNLFAPRVRLAAAGLDIDRDALGEPEPITIKRGPGIGPHDHPNRKGGAR